MTPLVSFVGNSGVGKTTFLEKLVGEMKARGYRVATIKHDVHNFEIDHPGKDTWRMTQAGSDIVMISSSRQLALIEQVQGERSLDELARTVEGRVDIVLTEGYRGASADKIEVSRQAHSSSLTAPAEHLIAVVADHPLATVCPRFDLEDAAGVADFLETKFGLSRRTQAERQVT